MIHIKHNHLVTHTMHKLPSYTTSVEELQQQFDASILTQQKHRKKKICPTKSKKTTQLPNKKKNNQTKQLKMVDDLTFEPQEIGKKNRLHTCKPQKKIQFRKQELNHPYIHIQVTLMYLLEWKNRGSVTAVIFQLI